MHISGFLSQTNTFAYLWATDTAFIDVHAPVGGRTLGGHKKKKKKENNSNLVSHR